MGSSTLSTSFVEPSSASILRFARQTDATSPASSLAREQGISQERVDKQFEIGKEFFDLPASEKKVRENSRRRRCLSRKPRADFHVLRYFFQPYAADLGNGGYNGMSLNYLGRSKGRRSR